MSGDYVLPFYANSDYFNFIPEQWTHGQAVSLANHGDETTLWRQVHLQRPQVVVLGVDLAILSSELIRRLSTIANRPTIVSIVKSVDESLLTECYNQGSDRVLALPNCSAIIFQALLDRLIKKEHIYPPYRIRSRIQTINFGDCEVRLTKRTFDVAQYLFLNQGKIVPKSKILQDLWGLDSKECMTRRVDIHVSHVRKRLALDGSHGWEIRTRTSGGCGIFQNHVLEGESAHTMQSQFTSSELLA